MISIQEPHKNKEIIMKRIKSKVVYLIFFVILFAINPSVFAVTTNKLQTTTIENKTVVTEVSPIEDLMREHGALSRVLLIYEEIIRRIENNAAVPTKELSQTTEIIQNFIQNYHEKLEENYVFVRFQNNKDKLKALVDTLLQQHQAGRKIIAAIVAKENPQNIEEKQQLVKSMRAFIKMYRPHKGREDTILFPALHATLSAKEYQELGETFEDQEHKLFGENGFVTIVNKIEAIEKSLGIYKLSQFTPRSF